jgi:hypothetical protein
LSLPERRRMDNRSSWGRVAAAGNFRAGALLRSPVFFCSTGVFPASGEVKVAQPLMLRAIAAAKKKNDRIDAGKIADCLHCDFLPECHMASTAIRDRRRTLRYRPAGVRWCK